MIRVLSSEHVHAINSILTAGSILDETIRKYAPNLAKNDVGVEEHVSEYDINRGVSSAIARVLELNQVSSTLEWV